MNFIVGVCNDRNVPFSNDIKRLLKVWEVYIVKK